MGSSFSSQSDRDPEGPGDNVVFFQDMNIRWLNVFIAKIKETKKGEFSLTAASDTLKWSDYFRIFVEIKDNMTLEAVSKQRSVWHPATLGYAMTRTNPADDADVISMEDNSLADAQAPPDDFTDDDPSVIDDDGDDGNGNGRSPVRGRSAANVNIHQKMPVESKPRGWDSQYTNPIYFGYSTQSVTDLEKQIITEKAELKARENRAIERARATRSVAIDALERSTTMQAKARLEKIEKLEAKYEVNKKKREVEFERNERELLAPAFAIYERKWELETQSAELAFLGEVGTMRKVHEEKSVADTEYLRNKREEMESFKDAEKQEIPAAERLEEFARIEVSRSIDELDKTGLEMENMRLEYREMKTDYEEVAQELAQAEARGTIDKAKQRRAQEMRSMVSVAETRMREAQRKVQDALEGLGDAEILLDRAVRLCKQQSDLLPLFSFIAKDVHLPSSCKLNALLIAMVVLMRGPFEQKYNILFRLFDSQCEGKVGLAFAMSLFATVQDALYLLRMLRVVATQDELVNLVTRGFMSYNLNPSCDLLTEYELKNMVMSLISHSSLLTKVLGLTIRTNMQPGAVSFEGSDAGNMGTFQRNRMSPLALLSRGMINLNMCKMRVHFDALRYKPCLQPSMKQQIHERSMQMGQDDPLKPDYTRFYVKISKVDEYRVPPLDHGHLHNLQFFENRIRTEAATKLQAWFRSGHDRKMAELAARHMAFKEAKLAALKEMKAKVVREFKKREGGKGMGKMKWDAQVRMKQAKLRTMGQAVGRSDTVMVMMEEAIAAAKEDIDAKFLELESKEEFSTFNFDRPLVVDDPARQVLDLTAKFGLILKPSIADSSMVQDDKNGEQMAKLLLEDEGDEHDDEGGHHHGKHGHHHKKGDHQAPHPNANGHKGPESDGTATENPAVPTAKPGGAALISTLAVIDPQRVRSYVQGKHYTPSQPLSTPNAAGHVLRGEDEMEFELRMLMAGAEASKPEHWFNRLRAINIAMTKFKTGEFLGEVPSKRLLVKYCAKHSDSSLVDELTKHFKFKNRQSQVVKLLRSIARTDLESGTMRAHLFGVQVQSEAGILNLFEDQMAAFEANLAAMIDLRLQTNKKLKEEVVLEEELKRMEGFVSRFRSQSAEMLATIDAARNKFNRTLLSCFEVEKKWRTIKRYTETRNGTLDVMKKDVPLELRFNWILRVNEASKMAENTPVAQRVKYSELRNVCREFLEIATSDAIIIIGEIYQPKYLKTIPVSQEHTVDGRREECGRGLEDGRYYSYEAHNIQYKVCLDYDGVFNGSDEYAAKAAGADRLGAQEYFKLQTPRLLCPLVVTIDYQGFRVLAVSKLPVQNVTFNEEGEVRKVSEDLEHGVQSHGEVFVNKSKIVQTYLKLTATTLNLAGHICKGSKDITNSSTFGSSELKIYRGMKDEYYMQSFWRSFPPEIPSTTPHLQVSPRDQSVFWRFLRPEYVRTCREALSPDACCAISYRAPDCKEHYDNLEKACKELVARTVPNFLTGLLTRQYVLPLSEGYGIDLTSEMHAQGINMRHLGLIRSKLWRDVPGTVSMYHHENYVRTTQDLRQEVSDGDSICVAGVVYLIQETPRRKITHAKIPVTERYKGESRHGFTARAGRVASDEKCEELRSLLLAEMLARTVKALVRLQMRAYNEQYKCLSTQFFCSLVTEYLNVVTGSSPTADVMFQQTLCESIRERFGTCAVRPCERTSLLQSVRPVLSYLINRIISMLGVKLCISCESEFHERPVAFVFTVADILEINPVTKHNIPILPFADAMMVSMHAATIEQEVYLDKVLRDEPAVFFILSERKGARSTDNKGTLGDGFAGNIRKGCELEHTGPVASNPFIRAMSFRPNAKAFVEVPYDPAIVPAHLLDHYTVELYFYCTGGKDTVRVMVMSGRYAIIASRDNFLTVVFYEGVHEINVKMVPMQYNEWVHVSCTYDGTTLRCYLNSVLCKHVEVTGILAFKQRALEAHMEEQREKLHEAEKIEQLDVKERSRVEVLEFFQTKDGVSTLKRISREIMESPAFQAENIGVNAKDQSTAIKEKRAEALKRAKAQHMRDHFAHNTGEIAKRYELLLVELEENMGKAARDAELHVLQGLRIGSATPNSKTVDGSCFFHGKMSCISVYNTCLTSDQIKDHYLCSVVDRRLDAQRMHGIAASKFELALKQGPPDGASSILNNYAKSLCSYLRIDSPDGLSKCKIMGKHKILDMIQQFKGMRLGNAVAEILREVPREPEHADLVAKGFLILREIDANFFSKSLTLQRKDLLMMPFEFALLSPESPSQHWEAAAYLFREVVRDVELMYAYGELDLRWLPELQSAPLVISIVKAAMEDKSLRVVKIAELFHDAGLKDMEVTDDDVLVLSQNLPISEGFDLSQCVRLTNTSLGHIDRMNNIKVLRLDHCSLVTDAGLKSLRTIFSKLQVFSVEGMALISDDGFRAIAEKCTNLQQVNVNKCPNITHETLAVLARRNPYLNTLAMAGTSVGDEAFSLICSAMQDSGCGKTMINMNISQCRELTDLGVTCMAEVCPNLQKLNMSGLCRVSDIGVRSVCANCWFLQHLNVEDIFLLKDDAFWFSATYDGRRAANDNMLVSMQYLNMTDCSNLTDRGIEGLAERCRKMDILILQGCDKITDTSLRHIADAAMCTSAATPMSDTIHTLSLAYSTALTSAGILEFLPHCACLETLDLSGLASIVTDSFVLKMSKACPTLQNLTVQKCLLLTDTTLCSLADNLWLERLDMTGCSKLTDAGVEVLSEACNGLRSVVFRRAKRLTNKSVFALMRNCLGIQKFDVQECPLITKECLDEALVIKPAVSLLHSL